MAVLTNSIVLTVRDAENKETNVIYYYDKTGVNTFALAKAEVDALAAALDAIIGGKVQRAQVTFDVPLPAGLKASAIVNSRVDAGATLSFENEAGRAWSHYIPTILGSNIAGGEVIQANIQAYIDEVYDPGMAGGVLDNRDENNLRLDAYRGGKQSTRKVG